MTNVDPPRLLGGTYSRRSVLKLALALGTGQQLVICGGALL